MQENHFLSRFMKGFATSLGVMFGLFLFVMIAYAFTTWDSGQAPQATPENGNVGLGGYTKGGLYGSCIQAVYSWAQGGYSNCGSAIAPATCNGTNCGCPAGFTILGITGVNSGSTYTGSGYDDATTNTYQKTCVKD